MTRLFKSRTGSSMDSPQRFATPPTQAQTPASPKQSEDPAMLAQRLGSESSWAEQYVPATPSDSVMTPRSSTVAGHTPQDAQSLAGDEPPPYELPTQSSPTQSNFQNQPLFNHPEPPRPAIPFPGRDYSRHEKSNSIKGTFTLYDSLDLSTESGSIKIVVDPRPGRKPAVLNLSTSSGSITVKLSDAARSLTSGSSTSLSGRNDKLSDDKLAADAISGGDLPFQDRVFQTNIRTQSGSVRVDSYMHGNGGWTHIETKSGSINLALHTRDSPSNSYNQSSIVTQSASGSQTISLTPIDFDDSSIRNIRAKHHSTGSGSLNVHYPRQWEGMVHGSVGGSANVNIKGQGLEYQHAGDREVYAWRGQGASEKVTVELRSDGSGSIGFSC